MRAPAPNSCVTFNVPHHQRSESQVLSLSKLLGLTCREPDDLVPCTLSWPRLAHTHTLSLQPSLDTASQGSALANACGHVGTEEFSPCLGRYSRFYCDLKKKVVT